MGYSAGQTERVFLYPSLFPEASHSLRGSPEGRTKVCLWGGGVTSPPFPATCPASCFQGVLTFGLDLESRADQSKQGGVEHDCPVTVERHVHGN